jgi:hypothetical protein
MKVKLRPMNKRFVVPIYEARIRLVVSYDVTAERKKFIHLFGSVPDEYYDAVCSYSGYGDFALFFECKPLSLNVLSHEVFHLTHRILDWVSANFDGGHHEQGALLHGYLMETIKNKL